MEVVTSVKRFLDHTTNKTYKRMLEIDIFATDVYTLGYAYDSMANLDYTKNMIMIIPNMSLIMEVYTEKKRLCSKIILAMVLVGNLRA